MNLSVFDASCLVLFDFMAYIIQFLKFKMSQNSIKFVLFTNIVMRTLGRDRRYLHIVECVGK